MPSMNEEGTRKKIGKLSVYIMTQMMEMVVLHLGMKETSPRSSQTTGIIIPVSVFPVSF